MIEQQLQCAHNHQLPIVSVILDGNLQQNERLLCVECIQNKTIQESQGIKIVLQTIEENQKYLEELRESLVIQSKNKINSLLINLVELKTAINLELDLLVKITKSWIDNLSELISYKASYSFHQELEKIIMKQKNGNQDIEEKKVAKAITNINEQWITKINSKIVKFGQFEEQKKCIEILNQLNHQKEEKQQDEIVFLDELKFFDFNLSSSSFRNSKKFQNQQNQAQTIKLQMIGQQVKQNEICYAISFNSDGTEMISGCLKTIKFWKFDNGNLIFVQNLQGHIEIVTCLLFSRRQQSFISGSQDKTIRCWQQNSKNEWKSSNPFSLQNDYVNCLLMNKFETQLFSAGNNGSIIVWKINFDQNQLSLLYLLSFNEHKFYSISLNNQENLLISSGQNNQILILEKGNQDKFKFKHIVKQNIDVGDSHIRFLSNDRFIWVPQSGGYDFICLFEKKNGNFYENMEKRIQIPKSGYVEGLGLVPIVYKQENNLIVVKCKNHIYIIQEVDGKFKIHDQINCLTERNNFSATNNLQFIVVWDWNQKAYQSYKLSYQ